MVGEQERALFPLRMSEELGHVLGHAIHLDLAPRSDEEHPVPVLYLVVHVLPLTAVYQHMNPFTTGCHMHAG